MKFKNKKVWHSMLKAASPIVLKFKTAPLDSDYIKDTKIIYFDSADPDVHLDGTYYVVEKGESEAEIISILEKIQKDVWVTVTAFGGGEDDDAPAAGLSIEAADQPVAQTNIGDVQKGRSTVGAGVAISAQYARESVLETYYEALRTAPTLLILFEQEFDRLPTDTEIELAQRLFAHWAIKGFDRPMFRGQVEHDAKTYREVADEPEDDAEGASDDQLEAVRTLAKLSLGSMPEIVDNMDERIKAGLTKDEADVLIQQLSMPAVSSA